MLAEASLPPPPPPPQLVRARARAKAPAVARSRGWGARAREPVAGAVARGVPVRQEDGLTDRDDAGMRMVDDILSDGHPRVPAGSRKRKRADRLSDLYAMIVSLRERPYCIRRDDDA